MNQYLKNSESLYSIEFYNETARQELLALPLKIRAKAFAILDQMKDVGPNLGMPYTRALDNGLFEIRAMGVEGIGRVFFCTLIGRKIILLRAFVKKTQKTPKKELELAYSRLKEVKNETP